MSKLQGKGLLWAEAYLSVHLLSSCSYDEFFGELNKTFAHSILEGSAARRLLGLRQGSRSIAKFLTDFCTATAEAKWPDHELWEVFC